MAPVSPQDDARVAALSMRAVTSRVIWFDGAGTEETMGCERMKIWKIGIWSMCLLLGACTSNPPPEEPAGHWSPDGKRSVSQAPKENEAGSPDDEITILRVDNESLVELAVFVYFGNKYLKLGTAAQGTKQVFVIPKYIWDGQFVIWSVHSKELHRTSPLRLEPAHLYIYTVRSTFSASSIEWYPFDKVPKEKQM